MALFENNQFPYTNFHEMNLDWIAEKIEDAAGISENINGRVTQCESDIQTLDGRMDTAEGRITSQGNRLTTAEADIDTLETTTGSQGTRLTTAEGDIDSLEGRMDTAEGDIDSLEGRMDTAEDDIDSLEGRMDTAEGDIVGLETEVDTKSTVSVEQILSGGVRVGNVTVDGVTTTFYAPTAGSTVVRAEDVPFSNTGVTPAMTAIDCQQAIEEVNTNTGALDTRLTTAEGNITTIGNNLSDLEDTVESIDASTISCAYYPSGSGTGTIQDVSDGMGYDIAVLETTVANLKKDIYYENDSNRVQIVDLSNVVCSGYIYSNLSKIVLGIPLVKQIDTAGVSPISNPDRYTVSLYGHIYVRGTNGYILNNVDVAGSGISNITVNFSQKMAMVTLTLATAATGVAINSPVVATFSNTPDLRWRYSPA